MTMLQLLCRLRRDLLATIRDVKDADQDIRYDRTKANSQIRESLEGILEQYKSAFAEQDLDSDMSKQLAGILDYMETAHYCASDKSPRSSIREWLWKSVLRINDTILPVPMETYVERLERLAGHDA